MSFKKMHESF